MNRKQSLHTAQEKVLSMKSTESLSELFSSFADSCNIFKERTKNVDFCLMFLQAPTKYLSSKSPCLVDSAGMEDFLFKSNFVCLSKNEPLAESLLSEVLGSSTKEPLLLPPDHDPALPFDYHPDGNVGIIGSHLRNEKVEELEEESPSKAVSPLTAFDFKNICEDVCMDEINLKRWEPAAKEVAAPTLIDALNLAKHLMESYEPSQTNESTSIFSSHLYSGTDSSPLSAPPPPSETTHSGNLFASSLVSDGGGSSSIQNNSDPFEFYIDFLSLLKNTEEEQQPSSLAIHSPTTYSPKLKPLIQKKYMFSPDSSKNKFVFHEDHSGFKVAPPHHQPCSSKPTEQSDLSQSSLEHYSKEWSSAEEKEDLLTSPKTHFRPICTHTNADKKEESSPKPLWLTSCASPSQKELREIFKSLDFDRIETPQVPVLSLEEELRMIQSIPQHSVPLCSCKYFLKHRQVSQGCTADLAPKKEPPPDTSPAPACPKLYTWTTKMTDQAPPPPEDSTAQGVQSEGAVTRWEDAAGNEAPLTSSPSRGSATSPGPTRGSGAQPVSSTAVGVVQEPAYSLWTSPMTSLQELRDRGF